MTIRLVMNGISSLKERKGKEAGLRLDRDPPSGNLKKMYDCPIKTYMQPVQIKYEGEIVRAVQSIGIDVNRAELIKAIQGDRERYEKAFREGWNACEEHYYRIHEEIKKLINGGGDDLGTHD